MGATVTRVEFAVARARVFAALTEPDLVRVWQYGSVLETDWTPGSPVRFTSEWEGRALAQWGTVLAFEPPRRVAYSLFAPRDDLEDRPEHRFTMTYELEDLPGGTRLTIRHDDPRPGADEDESSGDPEDPALRALRALLEPAHD